MPVLPALLGLALLSTVAQALRLTYDDDSSTWCPSSDPCVDSAYTSGGYVPQAARLGMDLDEVNLFNGELRVQQTDLRIPGVYGLDMTVQRVYSSKIVDETMAEVETSWAGLGWQILPGGRLLVEPEFYANHVWIELPGRGRQRAYALSSGDALYRTGSGPGADANAWPGQSGSTAWVTSDFTFVYEATSGGLRAVTTNGVVYEFDTDAGPTWDGWTYGESVFNANDDEVTIAYDTGCRSSCVT